MKLLPGAPHPESPRELQQVVLTERQPNPFFYFRDTEGAFRIEILKGSGEFSVGRNAENDLSITFDHAISSVHAVVQQIGGEWVIEDDGLSSNGTYVNGERIRGRSRLRDRDAIRIGDTVLVFRLAPRAVPRLETRSPVDREPVSITDAQRRVLIELGRPMFVRGSGTPSSNQEIADALFLSVETVKSHLRALYSAFGLDEVSPRSKRAELADRARQLGVLADRDY